MHRTCALDLVGPARPVPRSDRARTHHIIRICERQGVFVLADRAYIGAGPWVTTGLGRPPDDELIPTQRPVNPRSLRRGHLSERHGMAQVSAFFRRARTSPSRMTPSPEQSSPGRANAENAQ